MRSCLICYPQSRAIVFLVCVLVDLTIEQQSFLSEGFFFHNFHILLHNRVVFYHVQIFSDDLPWLILLVLAFQEILFDLNQRRRHLHHDNRQNRRNQSHCEQLLRLLAQICQRVFLNLFHGNQELGYRYRLAVLRALS